MGNFSIVLTTLPISPSVKQGPPVIATPVPWLDQLSLATVQSQRSTTHTFQAKGEIKNCSKMTRLDTQPWRPEIKQTQGQEAGAMAKSCQVQRGRREAQGKFSPPGFLLRGDGVREALWEKSEAEGKVCFNMGVRYSFWSRLTDNFSVTCSLTLLFCNAQIKSEKKWFL